MSEEPEQISGSLARIAGLSGLITLVLASAGFVAVRAYLSGLGLPPLTQLSFDQYVQYGGRFLIALAVHAIPSCLAVAVTASIVATVQRWLGRRQRASQPRSQLDVIGVLVAALAAAVIELWILQRRAVFVPGLEPLLGIPRLQMLILLIAEVLSLGSVFGLCWLASRRRLKWSHGNGVHVLPLLAVSVVVVQFVLLPAAFSRIAMPPQSYDRVVMDCGKERKPVQGLLVFSDSEGYFIWLEDERVLTRVLRSGVEVITFRNRTATE